MNVGQRGETQIRIYVLFIFFSHACSYSVVMNHVSESRPDAFQHIFYPCSIPQTEISAMEAVIRQTEVVVSFVDKKAVDDAAILRQSLIYTDNRILIDIEFRCQTLTDRTSVAKDCLRMILRNQNGILYSIVFQRSVNNLDTEYVGERRVCLDLRNIICPYCAVNIIEYLLKFKTSYVLIITGNFYIRRTCFEGLDIRPGDSRSI